MDDATPNLAGGKAALLGEMEILLREQIELQPANLRLRMRLAKLLADQSNEKAFLHEVQAIKKLTAESPDESALDELKRMAQKAGIDPKEFLSVLESRPQRRLGEDAASAQYFKQIGERYSEISRNSNFIVQHDRNLLRFFNRPSSLTHLRRYSRHLGGAQLAIKREDMMPPASKMRMAVAGQVFLAAHLGYKTVVTGSSYSETGVVMAQMAARLGLASMVFTQAQWSGRAANSTLHIRCVGGQVHHSPRGENPRDAAVDFCLKAPDRHFLVMGVEAAPEPYPAMNRNFVSALGRETRAQAHSMFKRSPDLLVTRGRHTPDAIGLIDPFIEIKETRIVCVDGHDSVQINVQDDPNVYDRKSSSLQFTNDQLSAAEAILERSEYPSVRREHKAYQATKRVEYVVGSISDARTALKQMAHLEGLLSPVRTAHAIGWAARAAKDMPEDQLVIVNLVEPFDKDLREVAEVLGVDGE